MTLESMSKDIKLYAMDSKGQIRGGKCELKLEPKFKREAFILSIAHDDEKGIVRGS